MSVKLTPDNIFISQSKETSKAFERDVILTVCDVTGHFTINFT